MPRRLIHETITERVYEEDSDDLDDDAEASAEDDDQADEAEASDDGDDPDDAAEDDADS